MSFNSRFCKRFNVFLSVLNHKQDILSGTGFVNPSRTLKPWGIDESIQTTFKPGNLIHKLMQNCNNAGPLSFGMNVKDVVMLAQGYSYLRIALGEGARMGGPVGNLRNHLSSKFGVMYICTILIVPCFNVPDCYIHPADL